MTESVGKDQKLFDLKSTLDEGLMSTVSLVGLLEVSKTSALGLTIQIRALQQRIKTELDRIFSLPSSQREETLRDFHAVTELAIQVMTDQAKELVEGLFSTAEAAQCMVKGFEAVSDTMQEKSDD